jgi:hypothetical protein
MLQMMHFKGRRCPEGLMVTKAGRVNLDVETDLRKFRMTTIAATKCSCE